ncbi:MAG: NADH-quinone oxidoreductase subunit NuoE [Deltaproteobacteria bacterium]|nr:NADH-quinone oxidoreductase subunit NuoE [Candidatus Tharpellaceae bacterium]
MAEVLWKSKVSDAIESYGKGREALLPSLESIQELFNYIPEEAITYLSETLSIPLVDIYGVITFYGMLTTEKQGKYVIRACKSLSCHINKSNEIISTFEKELNIKCGETTPDGKFTLESVACLGLCDKAPAMMINEKIYENLTVEKVKEVINELRR